MSVRSTILFLPFLLAAALGPRPALAEVTVECRSINYAYTECQAPLDEPQLIHQLSSNACIVNRTWGFNPHTRRIWVSDGCSGVFADPGGYHHGRSGTYDDGARQYDHHGNDAGAMVAGAIIGAVIGSAAASSGHHHSHSTSNYYYSSNQFMETPSRWRPDASGYAGCHGTGCLVDSPERHGRHSQAVDPTVQKFDKDGNPNYDADGNYIGGHGLGTTVDNPDAETSPNDGD
jgi:hypothetical protein